MAGLIFRQLWVARWATTQSDETIRIVKPVIVRV